MGSLLVVVGDEIGKDGRKMVLVNHDEVVQALTAQGPDDSFSHCVRTRRANRRGDGVDAEAPCTLTEVAAVDSIPITQQMARLVAHGVASISCRHTQAAVGLAVTLTCTNSRRPCAMRRPREFSQPSAVLAMSSADGFAAGSHSEMASKLAQLDACSAHHLEALADLEAAAAAAVAGETLLQFDVRADNVLLTRDRVCFVDWPYACVGAAWVDVVFFAPSVTVQGGPPPEEVIARNPACRTADPVAITATVAAVAGFFTHQALQPPPLDLPTVRAFQAAQGVVARITVLPGFGLAA